VFIRIVGQMPRLMSLIFVYVIMQNINKNINIVACRPTTKKSYGGLSTTR
jgi:hypothetical protein